MTYTLEEIADQLSLDMFWDVRVPECDGWQRAVKLCNQVDMALWALDGFSALGFTYRDLAVIREAQAHGR